MAGVWIGWVEPIRDQWAAVEPLIELGARVETSPSKTPNWMKSVLPTGQTENIEALILNKAKELKSDDLKCLARLPHLKRLSIEQCGLDDAGVAWIADCPTIEQLSIRNNMDVTNKNVKTLASLPNLKNLDVVHTGMKWRAIIAFQKNPQLEVVHGFLFRDARNSELETMAEINNTTEYLTILNADETSVPTAMRLFPSLHTLTLDRFESLNPSNIELLESHPELDYVTIRSDQSGAEKVWWQALLSKLDADYLMHYKDSFSIKFRHKDPNCSLDLRIGSVSLKDLALLKEIGVLSTIKGCNLFHLDSDEFEDLDFLGWLSNLEKLKLESCAGPKRIDFGLLSPKLQFVHLDKCEQLIELVNLVDFSNLTEVSVYWCPLKTIQNLDLPVTTKLVILSSISKQTVAISEFFKDVRSLGKLQFLYCPDLEDLTGIENISGLESLEIAFCNSVSDWSPVFKCHDLHELTLRIPDGLAQELPSPKLDFLAQLDKFSFEENSKSSNQLWNDAWRDIVASRETDAVPSD